MSSGSPGDQPDFGVGGNPSDYPVGGNCGQPSYNPDHCCECLSDSLKSIALSQQLIAQTLYERLGKPCDHIEECMDKIIDALRKRFERPLASCEECKSMVARGLGGTFEYVFACAGVTCKECDTICSLGDPTTEGKCCDTCGQEKCICKDGVCVPVTTEEQPKGKWIGWCHPETGNIQVTKQGSAPPGPGWYQVGLAESEQSAIALATANCAKETPTLTQPPTKLPDFGTSRLPFCSLSSLVSGETLNIAAGAQRTFYSEGGAIGLWKGLSDIGAFGIEVGDVTSAITGVFRMIAGQPAFYADVAATKFAPVVGCDNPTFQDALRLIISAQLFEKQSGANITEFLLPYQYAMHAACRQQHLDPDKAMAAYLSNAISREGLESLWAIHGYCPEDVTWYTHSAHSRPVPLELAVMRRRGLINDSDYRTGMRELGYLDQGVTERLFKITEQFPGLSDIMRLMVRDADDPNIPFWQESDQIFKTKYRDTLRKWAEAQGIPEEVALYNWRAHWIIPPPQALFEFYHRLRKNPAFGGEAAVLKQVENALSQQDILPFWQKYYLAVSFRPLGRVDVRRAYNIGSLTDNEVKEAYTQLGYSDQTVDQLFAFSKRLRDQAIVNHKAVKLWVAMQSSKAETITRLKGEGFPQDAIDQALRDAEIGFGNSEFAKAFVRGDMDRTTFITRLTGHGVSLDGSTRLADKLSLRIRKHPAAGEYAVGMITDGAARAEMLSYGLDSSIVDRIITDTDRAVEQSFVANCQKGIKRRYLTGELSRDEAEGELTKRGTTAKRAGMLVNWWECERDAGGKAVATARLCDWLAKGAISSVEMAKRLERIGYTHDDAALIVDDCLVSISVKRLAQAKKEAKEQAALDKRKQAAIQKQIAAINRLNAQQQRATQQAAKTRERRDKQLLSAAEMITGKSGVELYDALQFVKGEQKRIVRDYGLSTDESLQVLLLSAKECKDCPLEEISIVISEMAETAATAGLHPAFTGNGKSDNSNGSTQPSS